MNEKEVQVFSYKDETPTNTIKRIKAILQKYNVNVTESWWETGAPHCYIVVITVDGTSFRTTGKGLTKELALASGYGELMERFQLGYIGRKDVQKDGVFSSNDIQSEVIDANVLLERNSTWYELLSNRLQTYVGKKYSPDEIVMQYADKDGKVLCTPYYCVTTDSKEYLPVALRKAAYTANGCASGNTFEEAIVHAISEIVERYSLFKISLDNITPPDIPECVLQQFSYAYSIITHMREQGYTVVVKDCSLGKRYPVVCVCYINQADGRYHTHYGADPILEIAIERALIEPFQGRSVDNLARLEDFAKRTEERINVSNLEKEVVWGTAEKPYFLFTGTPNYVYNENVGFPGKSNRELLNECVTYFKDMGYDIIIRDSSCLSFPTVQVIIPGYSEVACHRVSPTYEDNKAGIIVSKALKDLSKASVEELLLTLTYITKKKDAFSKLAGLHLKIEKKQETCLMWYALAYINYSFMRYSETIKYINLLLNSEVEENNNYLLCLKRYLSLLEQTVSLEEIKSTLKYFHHSEVVEKLFTYIEQDTNPLNDFIVHCDMNCNENCYLHQYCCKEYVSNLIKLINEKTLKLDFVEFSNKIRELID